jgi:phosphatidylglycerophosphate synthase
MKNSYQEIRRLCLKPDEAEKPWYARHITHTFSTRLIWLLQELPLSANSLSLFSLLVALSAIPFLADLSPNSMLIGALLIEGYYVLDAVDGQWARLKGQKSLTGAFFDYLINLVIQPPILFAIGYGVFRASKEPLFLWLGFTAAFSTQWLILVWNVRAAVLLGHLTAKNRAPIKPSRSNDSKEETASPARFVFGWLHKSMVFPWFMAVLSISALVSFIAESVFGKANASTAIFSIFLFYYGFGAPLVALLSTARWIGLGLIDRAPEIAEG